MSIILVDGAGGVVQRAVRRVVVAVGATSSGATVCHCGIVGTVVETTGVAQGGAAHAAVTKTTRSTSGRWS